MNTKDLKLLKQKLQTLNELETKERDKYLRDIALGKIYGPQTNYPSIDKSWLKYYPESAIDEEIPQMKAYDYVHENNKHNLDDICIKMENVFEQFIEVPNRITIKEIMRNNGACGVCMSGSGPTVFGIFKSRDDAESAAKKLKDYAKDICVCTPVNRGCKIDKIIE